MKKSAPTKNIDFDQNSGISLIEILLVISLVIILAGASTPFLSRFILQNNLSVTTNTYLSTLQKAQIYSMSGKNDTLWGVCLNSGMIRLYYGSCLDSNFIDSFQIRNSIVLSGQDNILFDKKGEPNVAGQMNISSSLGSKTIIINEIGKINEE
jgi:type II secretory pathway pseudopilin PulG